MNTTETATHTWPDPGTGWRLLTNGEPLQPGDGYWHPDYYDWIDYACRPDIFKGAGHPESGYYVPANDTAHTWPWRRKVKAAETVSGEFHVTDSGTEFVPKGRHTSGPWFVSGASIVTGGDECCIANIETDGGYEATSEEQTANAALIAKAWLIPDLMAFAQAFIEWSEKQPINATIAKGQLYGQALRVVEKATL